VRKVSHSAVIAHAYSKEEDQIADIVDTDGLLYSNADAYAPTLTHGNPIHQSLEEMRANSGYHLALAESQSRMKSTCESCEYFGSCSGFFMAEATPERDRPWTADEFVPLLDR
jgi:uncharacterized protein